MKAPWVIVLFVVAMALAFVGGRCSVDPTPSPEAPLPDPVLSPPDTVRITKVKTIVVPDSSWREKYDSLLASVHGNQDSAIHHLAQPWEEQHEWQLDKNQVHAAGRMSLKVFPVEKDVAPAMILDTLQLPPPIIRTETKETISVAWLVAAIAAGFGIGAWVGSR